MKIYLAAIDISFKILVDASEMIKMEMGEEVTGTSWNFSITESINSK